MEHPYPGQVREIFDALGLNIDIGEGAEPRLIAIINTPRGRIELR